MYVLSENVKKNRNFHYLLLKKISLYCMMERERGTGIDTIKFDIVKFSIHLGAVKRSGLSLDFIDSLLSEFGEEEPMDDQLPSNTMLHDPLPSNSLLHEPLSSKSLLHEPVSDNSLLHAPSLHEESLTREPMINEAHNQEKMLADVLAHEKDPMSNVIPGMCE